MPAESSISGGPTILAEVRDITERKQAEEALQESEERYRLITDNMEDTVWLMDMNLRTTFISPSVVRTRGFTLEELKEMPLEKHLTPTSLEVALKEIAEKMSPKELEQKDYTFTHTLDLEFYRKEGSTFWHEVKATLLRDDEGCPAGLLCISRDVAERKQAEGLFRVLFENSPSGVYIAQDGKFQFVNSQFQRYTGYSENELLGMGPLQLVILEDRNAVKRNAVNTLKGRCSSPYECRIANKRGEVRWILETVASVQYGGRQSTLGNYMDITERKQAEEALRQSEERYRTILEEIQDSYFEMDPAGNVTFCNNTMCRDLGYPREELMGLNSRAYIAPEDVDVLLKTFSKAYQTGKTGRSPTFKFVRKDGVMGFGETWVSPLRNQGGEIIGFRGLSRDITKRKQAEEALRQSEEKYRTITDDMKDGYYETDLAGNYTFFNDSLCQLFGYSREEMMGMNYRVYTPAEDVNTIFEHYNRMYRTGEPIQNLHYKIVRRDGSIGYSESSVFPLRNQEGEIIGFRGIRRDITERKRMEEERKELERKAQLASRLATVGEMASGIAHEINNPLTGVIGYAQLLMQRQDIPEDAKKDLKVINDGGQRVAGIVSKMLTFARQYKPQRTTS